MATLLQNANFANSSQTSFNNLVDDSKVYVTAAPIGGSALNMPLNQAVAQGYISKNVPSIVVANTNLDSFDCGYAVGPLNMYMFVIAPLASSVTSAVRYYNNGQSFFLLPSNQINAGIQYAYMYGTGAPSSSGTLYVAENQFSASNITFSSFTSIPLLNNSVIRHQYSVGTIYQLPPAFAGARYTFINEAPNPNAGAIGDPNSNFSNTTVTVTTYSNQEINYNSSINGNCAHNIAAGTYYHGPSSAGGSFGAAIQTALQAGDAGNSYTVAFDYINKFYTITSSPGTFYFRFASGTLTYSFSSAATAMGFLPVDGVTSAVQVGFPVTNQAVIVPTSGNQIYWGNKLAASPGYISLKKRGVAITLNAVDSITWEVESGIGLNYLADAPGWDVWREIALVGRNAWVSVASDLAKYAVSGFSLNGYGYAVDGYATGGVIMSTVTQYNDSSNTWAAKANDISRGDHTSFPLNGYGYAIDGYSGAAASNVTQYNDSSNTWTAVTNDTTVRDDASSFSLNGYGYAIDGFLDFGPAISTVTQYNDSANTWTAVTNDASTRYQASGFSLNGYGYAIDGWGAISTVTQYNDSANTWTAKANDIIARLRAAAFPLNGYGYVAGGELGSGVNISTVSQYNDSANTWTAKANDFSRIAASSFSLNGYGYAVDGNTTIAISTVTQYN